MLISRSSHSGGLWATPDLSVLHKLLAVDISSVHSLWLNMNHLVNGNYFNSSFLGAWVTILSILCSSPFLPGQDVFTLSLNMFFEAQSQTPFKVIYSHEHPKALTTLGDWYSAEEFWFSPENGSNYTPGREHISQTLTWGTLEEQEVDSKVANESSGSP